MAHLHFDHVTIQYPIYNSRTQSVRHQLMAIGTGGRLGRDGSKVTTVTALSDVSFHLTDGDRVGLIGHNGAGKTTLLRTMAGIYPPAGGTIRREGRTSTIIEVGSGMDVELSGYENIRRMGLLLGLSQAEIDRVLPDIEAFTDLGDYLHMPVRIYSSGMTTRLMFAVATASRPEILLVDEMLGAGDADFQKRAEQRMTDLIHAASIFVFASHSHDLIRRFCKRVFRLEHGTLTEVPLDSL